jgi:hypothetical protein
MSGAPRRGPRRRAHQHGLAPLAASARRARWRKPRRKKTSARLAEERDGGSKTKAALKRGAPGGG